MKSPKMTVSSRDSRPTTCRWSSCGRHPAAYPYAYVPPQKEVDLRQTRWQKIYYPSTVRNVVTTSFHPYTMIETYGPLTTGSGENLWPRIWEGRKWMPFSWVEAPRPGVAGNGITFYGPYMVVDTSTGELP